MTFVITRQTQRNNVETMLRFITKIMVVYAGGLAAIGAFMRIGWGQLACFYCVTNHFSGTDFLAVFLVVSSLILAT